MPKIGQEAIGTHVEVYWEDQEEWYQGYIKAYDTVKGYFVQYEDGDEQWERDFSRLKFLEKEKQVQEQEHDKEYDDQEEEEKEEEFSSTSLPSVYSYHPNTSRKQEEKDIQKETIIETETQSSSSGSNGRLHNHPQKNPTTSSNKLITKKACMFFRDKEELVELKRQLSKEKKQLQEEVSMLEQNVHSKQELSMSLQTQLKELKAHLVLTNVDETIATKIKLHPQSDLEWKDFILDFQLQNKQLIQENQVLKEKIHHLNVANMEQKIKQLDIDSKKKFHPIDFVSLMDLQVEMSTLVQEKRHLEEKIQHYKHSHIQKNNMKQHSKEELETQLEKIELTTQRLLQEKEIWQKNFDTEKAKVLSLQNRLLSLEKKLIPYQQSKILLHSLFQRLLDQQQENNNTVHIDVALDAFSMILPKPIDLTKEQFVDTLRHTLTKSQVKKTTQLNLEKFVEMFQTLVINNNTT